MKKDENMDYVPARGAFRELFDLSPVGSVVVGLDRKFLRCNKVFADFLEYSPEEILEKTIDDFTHPDDRHIGMEEMMAIIQGRMETNRIEKRYITKSGKIVWGEVSICLVRDDKNNPLYFLPVILDITKRKQIEETLIESEEKFKTIADYTSDWEFWISEENLPVYISPSCKRITGFGPEEFMADPALVVKIIHPEDQKSYSKHVKEILKSRQFHELDFRIITSNGEEKWINQVCQPVYNNHGRFIGLRGSNRDISLRKSDERRIHELNEKLQKQNTDKDRLMSILVHDLRSPFNALLGISEILHKNFERLDPVKIRKYLSSSHKSLNNIYHLLDDLLLWIRSQSGLLQFHPRIIQLSKILTEISDYFGLMAASKQITLEMQYNPNLLVLADEDMIKTVLRNLTSNALKFTHPKGKVIVFVLENGTELLFSVVDNGVGMNASQLNNLFDLSVMKPSRGTENEKGSGFGLMLAREFIEKHGGFMFFESEPGVGTRVSFSLPHQDTLDLSKKADSVNQEKEASVSGNSLKILIAEDDEMSREVLYEMLQPFSTEIYLAHSGTEALEICRRISDMNLIFMDIRMPGLNGIEATRKIKEFNRQVVIVIQTAYYLPENRLEISQSGCDLVLTKPISFSDIENLMRKFGLGGKLPSLEMF